MQRTDLLREEILDTAPALCFERARLITESYRENEGQPTILKKARAFASILKGMSIYIGPGELVVGNQAGRPRAAPIFPEYGAEWVLQEMDDFSARGLDRFEVGEETKRELQEAIPYWKGKSHYDRVTALAAATWPPELMDSIDLSTLNINEVMRIVSNATGDGHATPNFERTLKVGLTAIMEEADALNQALDL